MPNPNYNTQVAQGYSAKGGKKYAPKGGGGPGAEHDAPHKDTETPWPKPGPTGGAAFNRATKVPVVKTHVVKAGVL